MEENSTNTKRKALNALQETQRVISEDNFKEFPENLREFKLCK